MKTKKWSAFLAAAVLTLGMGLFMTPSPALAKQHNHWGNQNNNNNNNYVGTPVASVPEPSTVLLLASGMAGLAMYGRKRGSK